MDKKILNLFSPHVGPKKLHGLAVAMVDGEKRASVCLGYAKPSNQTLLNTGHFFEIASLTKTFIGLLFSKMFLEMHVSLKSNCSQFLPDLLHTEMGKVTVQELLTHSSGIPRLPSNLKPQNPMNPYSEYSNEDLLQELLQLTVGPKKYLYSNLGFAILGKIAENIFKDKIPNILRQEVLIPLGITEVNFSTESSLVNLTDVHHHEMKNVEHWVLGEFEAAGGMRANILQMEKYLFANVWPEKTVLSKAISESHQLLYSDDETKVGMAWHNGIKHGNVFHDGGTYGSSSFMEFNPKTRKGIVILSNTYSDFKELIPAIDTCLGL